MSHSPQFPADNAVGTTARSGSTYVFNHVTGGQR